MSVGDGSCRGYFFIKGNSDSRDASFSSYRIWSFMRAFCRSLSISSSVKGWSSWGGGEGGGGAANWISREAGREGELGWEWGEPLFER